MFREHHTVSALLSRMEKKGLIIKTKNLDKQNHWRVSLTKKGQETYGQSLKRESIHAAMSPLSKAEHQRLGSYLKVFTVSSCQVFQDQGKNQRVDFDCARIIYRNHFPERKSSQTHFADYILSNQSPMDHLNA